MRLFTLLSAVWIGAVTMMAQEGHVVSVALEARGDYQRDYVDGEAVKSDCGFKGKFLNLRVDGDINEHFSYTFRHRLNKTTFNSEFFDATDWLQLEYRPDEHWSLSGGKQVVDIGGWEYDRAPIDLYFCSEFWNQIPCYQWGARVAYKFSDNDRLGFQFCQSPFYTFTPNNDIYAYNLMWTGKHGVWKPLWSVNMMEWRQGRFINYIALGNAFDLGKVRIELDFMNRASSHQTFLFKDCSVMGEIAYRPIDKLNIFAHATYDVNRTDNECDWMVMSGTELTRIGAGIEYYPLKKYNVRLHANYCYTWGTNTNPDGLSLNRQSLVDVGVTWKVSIFKR